MQNSTSVSVYLELLITIICNSNGQTMNINLDGKTTKIGSFYSAYEEAFIDGLSLWSSDILEDNIDSFMHQSSQAGLFFYQNKS